MMNLPFCLRSVVVNHSLFDHCVQVEVRPEPFSPWSELERWSPADAALAMFVGRVRGKSVDGAPLQALELEHYPGMTEARIAEEAEVAMASCGACSALVLHRVGRLNPGEVIVLVAVAAGRRGPAQSCCASLLEGLKHDAPIWKREWCRDLGSWLEGNTPR